MNNCKRAVLISPGLWPYAGFLSMGYGGNCKTSARPPGAASEGEVRSVVATLSLGDEAIAPPREGGRDESIANASIIGMRI